MRRLLGIFLLLAGFAAFTWQNGVDQDLWGHLAFGRATWLNGGVLRADPYAYVPTRPWVNHEWLCEAIYYLILAAAGSVGLLVFKGLLGAGAAWCAGSARRAPSMLVAGVATIALLGMRNDLYTRPYIFSYAGFAATIYLLESRRRYALWLLPPLIGLWANCHAAFVVGLGTTAIYLAGSAMDRDWDRVRRLAVALTMATLATLLNPYGVRYWPFVIEAVTMSRPYITEWRSLPWSGVRPELGPFGDFVFTLRYFPECKALLLAVAIVILWRRRWSGRHAVACALLGITAWMALSHYRHVPLFLLAAVAYGPSLVADGGRENRRLGVALCAAALTVVAILLPRLATGLVMPLESSRSGVTFPANAVRLIQANGLRGNLLIFFDWGEFAIWELWPACKVSFDGRLETVYPREAIEKNLDFTFGKSADMLRDADVVLVRLKTADFVRAQPGWREVYRDEASALFVPASRVRPAYRRPGGPGGSSMPLDEWLGRP